MGFRTIVIEKPCKLSYRGGYMEVRLEDDVQKYHLSEISSIILESTQVYFSAYLASELAKSKILTIFCDKKHLPVGQYLPLYGAHNCSKRIQEQIAWGEVIKKQVWQAVVKYKIDQQANLLSDRNLENSNVLFGFAKSVKSGDTTNREAQAARVYFSSLFGENFTREIDSPLNAALNYGYSILLAMVSRELSARGYLTQIGICHRNEYNQFNLACDLMEPFRPLVDRVVLDNFEGDFTRDLRLTLLSISTMVIEYKDGVYKVSSVVSLFVQDCLNALNKKIMVDEISSFKVVEDEL